MKDGVKVFLSLAIGMVAVFLLIVAAPRGCTDPAGTKRVLEDQGFSNVTITGWRPFSGSDSDTFHTGFEATAPSGHRVTGTVTSGWWKGHTIRMD